MPIREEIAHILTGRYPHYFINKDIDGILEIFEKLIDEEIEGLLHKKKDKDLFLDGDCIDSTLQMLEKLKVLLK